MSSPQPESELQDRVVPKFSSFRPSSHDKDGPQVKTEPAQVPQLVPKFSSFKTIAPVLEHRSNASNDSGSVAHKRLRSRSRQKDRGRNRSHRHDVSDHSRRDKHHYRDGSRGRHQHKRIKGDAEDFGGEGEREIQREKRRHMVNDVDHNIQKQKEPIPSEVLPWGNENPSVAELFYINTKGDPANLVYGTIHRYSIPQYYRFGKGGIIGLKNDIKIIHDKGDGKGLILSTRGEHVEKYKRGSNGEKQYRFAIPEEKGLRRLRISAEVGNDQRDTVFESGLAYIPLTSRPKRLPEASDIHDQHLFDLPFAKDELDGGDLVYASPSDDEVDEMLAWNSAKFRQKQFEIQQQVDNDPSDVSAWLALVYLQDDVLYNGAGRKKRPTLAERKSSAEIKLSIMDKALKKVPQSDVGGLEKLWDCWFDVAIEIWEPEKLLSKYRSTLRQYPTMHTIWVKYLNFRQSDFNSFKYTEMVECYEQCLEVLRTAVHNKSKDDNDILRLEQIALYVIFRGFYFMREAGYIENSIAALQGLLELNLFAPGEILKQYPLSSHESFEIILDQLRDFWESEVLRAGEEDAEGWYRYVEKGKDGPVPEGSQMRDAQDDPTEIDQDDPFGWWIQKEIESNELRENWPARVVDENEDDPFNVVLFNDISRWMFCFGHEASRRSLIDYMLHFCGLPRWLGSREQLHESFDTFLCCYKLAHQNWFWVGGKAGHPHPQLWEGMEPEKKGSLIDPFGFRLDEGYPVTQDMLFGRQNGEWVYPIVYSPASYTGRTADIRMARTVLRMIIDGISINPRDGESLVIFYWALEWRIDPLKAQKLAKTLLTRFRTSLLLYNAYAQIEWRMGNIEMARKIFTTALGMCSAYPEDTRRDAIILWKTWAWEELLDRNHQEALNVLLSVPNGKLNSSRFINDLTLRKAELLRAKRFLIDEQDRFASLGLVEHASAVNEAIALMEYLSPLGGANMDLSTALPIYDSLLQELREKGLSTSRQYEITLMNGKIRLLYHHSRTSRSFRIASLREALEDAITELSKVGRRVNTLFWSLYAWNEGRSRIEGRVKGWLRDQIIRPTDRDNTIAGYVFTIWTELRMSGNSAHAIRHLFERAIDCQFTRMSAELWKLYIEFEIREQNPTRAKMVLFRALRCCPWSKDIAMLAFTKLMPVLDFDELKKILSISTMEKELRVVTTATLEDYLEEIGDGKGRELYTGLGTLKLSEDAIE